MCGISGIAYYNGQLVPLEAIQTLTNAIAHRGPNGQGIWLNKTQTIALGHRRLAILDLSDAGAQPMTNSEQRFFISFNGEVFNFIEIRAELSKRYGFEFVTDSDTEVILRAYEVWGKDMLHRFNGMWALAIYDTHTDQLFLARDRYGIKPLYYSFKNQEFIWASEVQAVAKLHATITPNKDAIENLAKGGFDAHGSHSTYLENIYTLPAGHCININSHGKIQIEQWYFLRQVRVPASLEAQAKHLRELIFDACKLRLRSDVPVATCLSGGVDSGSITAVIDQLNTTNGTLDAQYSQNYKHVGFCASFEGTPLDEKEQALRLTETLDLSLEVCNVTEPSIEELEEAMRSCDGPMHALAFFPIWKLYKYIRSKGITVTLDGQGPDEMLGGYQPIHEALNTALAQQDWHWFDEIIEAYQHQGESKQVSSKRNVQKAKQRVLRQHFRQILLWPRLQVGKILRSMGLLQVYVFDNTSHVLKPAIDKPDFIRTPIDESLFNQFFFNPLPAILQQYDRCSMAHGIECRMPFMDYRIVEFIFSLPAQSKIGKGYTKLVLREAMRGILPDFIRLNRTKIGFNAPIVDWFRGGLKDWILAQMNEPSFLANPYFDGKDIKQRFENFLATDSQSWAEAWAFWPAVHLNWWLQRQPNFKPQKLLAKP